MYHAAMTRTMGLEAGSWSLASIKSRHTHSVGAAKADDLLQCHWIDGNAFGKPAYAAAMLWFAGIEDFRGAWPPPRGLRVVEYAPALACELATRRESSDVDRHLPARIPMTVALGVGAIAAG